MKNKLINQIKKCLVFIILCNWTLGSLLLTVSSDSINFPSTSAVYTDLTDSPIFIDDSSTEYNWNKISSDNPWCTGNGTSEDPYIIQDIIISSSNSDSIIIYNSDVFFMIANCIVHTSMGGSTRLGSGIVFNNVSNGIIINSEILENKHDGIGLYNSNNILIYNNYIHNNNGSGIKLGNCSNVEFNTNIITYHVLDGIEHFESNYSKIYNNDIGINDDGIVLSYSSHNEIADNNIHDNSKGVFLQKYSHYNRITSNTLSNNLYCIMIGTSCQDTYYHDNGECNYYSYNETSNPPPIPPPDDPEPEDDNDNDERIPGYDLFSLFGVICAVSLILIRRRLKLSHFEEHAISCEIKCFCVYTCQL